MEVAECYGEKWHFSEERTLGQRQHHRSVHIVSVSRYFLKRLEAPRTSCRRCCRPILTESGCSPLVGRYGCAGGGGCRPVNGAGGAAGGGKGVCVVFVVRVVEMTTTQETSSFFVPRRTASA
jgi:hypothetical protein